MRTKGTITLFTLGSLLSAVAAQAQTVPVRELAAAEAKSTQTFGNIFGLRQLAGGKVLVNDGIRRQLVILDDKLSNPTIVIDSVSEGGQSYGPRPSPLIPYLADSSLFVDGTSLSLLVLDPFGKIAHVMSAPKPSDLRFLAGGASGVDGKGNLVYRGALTITQNRGPQTTPNAAPAPIQPPDSAPVVRGNFDTRSVDTIGRVKIQQGNKMNMTPGADGKPPTIKLTINPLTTVDDWAVLSDGSVAFVRGHDYSIDWIRPDGSTFTSAKLPFDWKRLTDDDKQKLIDSARTAMDKATADAKAAANTPGAADKQRAAVEGMAAAMGAGGGGGMMVVRMDAGGGGGRGGDAQVFTSGPGGPPGAMQMAAPTIEFVPLKEIADYYPAIRPGAAKADLDGNLWILPTTSAQAKNGELVYDVVNNKGELFQRVRLPLQRSIAGFGHNGIVYLMSRDDATKTWTLERTRILNTARATN